MAGPESQAGDSAERGLFVVVDGVDGCGKSTQAARLADALGVEAELRLREPGSTALGEGLRELLLSRELEIPSAVETLLFAAARRQLLEERVAPALAAGRTVVCERFNPSTYAYQAVAGELDEGAVLDLLDGWAAAPAPDLVVLLDLPVELAAARRGAAEDRIEDKGTAFQARVAEGYRRWAERDPRAVLVDASGDPDQVHAAVLREVERVRDR